MNELQNKYIRNQILSVPMKLNQELTHKDKKFNKRSDYDNIISKSKEECIYELDKTKLNLLTIGRLVTQKGYDLLLDIASNLKRKNIN